MHRHPPARRHARRVLLAAAALCAVLAAPPARAQQRDAARTAVAPRAAPADVPLPPPPAGTRLEHRGATLAVGVGPWVGFSTGSAVAVHVDYGFPRTPAGWSRVELEYRLAVMMARPSYDKGLTSTVVAPFPVLSTTIDVGTKKTRAWVVEAVPTARLRLPLGPNFAVFADGGVGLAQSVERSEANQTFAGTTVKTQNVTGLVLRLGGGASFDVGERLRILFLPVALSLEIGPGYGAYTPTLAAAYRM